jgi:4-hydroxy-tetrahydrodipicolinate synthase
VTGLFALGSSGEAAYLTDESRARALEVIVATAAGQVPVLAGAIDTGTERVVAHARAAAKQGAAAIVATAPFYVRTEDAEVDRHFRAVAAAAELPVLAYDVPVSVGRKLDRTRLLALAADGVLAGVKDSSGDDVALRQLILDAAELPRFSVLTGHEVVVDGAMLSGAHGCVPGLGNVDPHGYRRLVDRCAAGDWAAARAEQDRLARLFRIVDVAAGAVSAGAAGVGAFKTALMLRGVIAGNTLSRPMTTLTGEYLTRIARLLDAAGLR